MTHDRREVALIADYMMIMKAGKIIASDDYIKSASDLSHSYTHDTNIISVLDVNYVRTNENYLIEAELGKELILLRDQNKINCVDDGQIRIQVPASEVSIHLHKNPQSSILNQIAVTVSDISQELDGQQMVLLTTIETEQKVIASVTSHSVKALKLKIGLKCYGCFKAVALNF